MTEVNRAAEPDAETALDGAVSKRRSGGAFRRALSALVDRLLPTRCTLCRTDCDGTVALCAACHRDLRALDLCCPRCAEPLEHPAPLCGRCLKRLPAFDRSFAAFRYAWPLDGLVARFKFSGDLAAGRTLARLFADRVRMTGTDLPALLVPVPLHRERLRERGYDQALELARDIGRDLDIAVAPWLLERTRATARQTDLDAGARRRNVRSAFQVSARALARRSQRPAIALIDDVMTTGSTMNECAKMLRMAGFTDIRAWAIARAPARS